MTDTDCLRNCPPSSHDAPDFPLNERVLFPSRPCLCRRCPSSPDIGMWVTCRIFVPQNIFTIGCVRGRVSVSGFPRGMGGDWRGAGAAIYWILEMMGLRSVWEHIGMVSRGRGQQRSDISPSSSHPPHPWARPGSVLFCMIIIIITRLSHRPASSAGVTGPREPVPKQYQENKSEDQL